MRTTGRNLTNDLTGEKAAPDFAREKTAPASASWHNDMLTLSEHIISKHAADLTARRRQCTITSNRGLGDSRWLKEVECFVDEVIEGSGCHVKRSPELLRAVEWMIAGATARCVSSEVPLSPERGNAVEADAA